ncbi:unnamed protein product [Spirodela intermedia]|uniref:At4g14310 8-bladed propeller domain-containing protein n=1 Tax=Spirodela intermedia TaxID=51605 RepID=A0A7I8IWY7_SPIIN|nr:unnamed protein product [Spirodela intermedia]CAA6662504.1 unnamed protein product [Spirodela intermedia]
MSSRLKERGGGGGKIMALQPQRCALEGTPKGKVAARRAPSVGKENPGRTPGLGKENPGRTPVSGRENPRAVSRGRVAQGMVQRPADGQNVEKGQAPLSVRWSTSSVPRGRSSSNPSDFARLIADFRARGGIRDRHSVASVPANEWKEKVMARDPRIAEPGVRESPATFKVVERFQQPRKVAASRDTANGSTSVHRLSDSGRSSGILGSHLRRSVSGPRGSNLEGIRGKTLSGHADDSSVIECADSKQRKNPATRNECLKVLESRSSGRVVQGLEVGKKNAFSASDSRCTYGKASESIAVLENHSKSHPVAFHVSRSSEMPSDVVNRLTSYKEDNDDGLALSSKAACEPSAVMEVVSEKIVVESSGDSRSNVAAAATFADGVTVSKNLIEHKSDAEKVTGAANRYSSKLHEKLAYLEGKVQRIASDIKRTKDILDSNNPNASKLLLSDIQSKISGIEKAVSHVIGGTGTGSTTSFPLKDETLHRNAHGEIGGSRNSAKDLNLEEIEARFFPHHRLIRSQTSELSSKEDDVNCKPISPIHISDPVTEDRSLSPIDENPIALEFLASLKGDKLNASARGSNVLFDSVAIQQMESGNAEPSERQCVPDNLIIDAQNIASMLTSDEKIEDFEDQENKPVTLLREETEDSLTDQLFEIGSKSSTGGWFVSEGEAALIAHSDGSCSYFDIANNEGKAEYNPPADISSNLWGDCWLIRAPGVDGCAGRYVVAASAGNTLESGFCAWDFYTKDVRAFRIEEGRPSSLSSTSSLSRTVLAPLPNTALHIRGSLSTTHASAGQQWWYRPCGPLLVSASSRQNVVNAFDIRDGELVMTWNVQNPVMAMEHSSPLQWRSRGKVVLAEPEGIRLWDVNSLNPQPLLSVASGKRVTALHVNNTDAELGGGIRQRMSSSEVEGNDGAFCTHEEVNVIDLRLPSGVGLKIAKPGCTGESIFSRGDSIYLGCTETTSPGGKVASSSVLRQFSLRKGKLAASYPLPEANVHAHHSALTQVWGNANLVMGVCGMGLFVFDALRNDGGRRPNDLYCPSFDYLGSRVLVISRDRPAMCRHLF